MTLVEVKKLIFDLRGEIMFGRGDDDGCEVKHLPPWADTQLAAALSHLHLAEMAVQMADYYRMRGE
jgi:hypothetical protein